MTPEQTRKDEDVCRHLKRRPYDPEWSVGDESDYQSRCISCGQVLRDAPNRQVRPMSSEQTREQEKRR